MQHSHKTASLIAGLSIIGSTLLSGAVLAATPGQDLFQISEVSHTSMLIAHDESICGAVPSSKKKDDSEKCTKGSHCGHKKGKKSMDSTCHAKAPDTSKDPAMSPDDASPMTTPAPKE